MGGFDPTADVDFRKWRGEKHYREKHVRRDMQQLLQSLEYLVERSDGHLMPDERAMLQQIADDYGLEWPDNL